MGKSNAAKPPYARKDPTKPFYPVQDSDMPPYIMQEHAMPLFTMKDPAMPHFLFEMEDPREQGRGRPKEQPREASCLTLARRVISLHSSPEVPYTLQLFTAAAARLDSSAT